MKMDKESTLNKLEKEIEQLTISEQLELIERIIRRIKKIKQTGKPFEWDKLYGIGKGLWEDEDAQEYVNRLREDRI